MDAKGPARNIANILLLLDLSLIFKVKKTFAEKALEITGIFALASIDLERK